MYLLNKIKEVTMTLQVNYQLINFNGVTGQSFPVKQ
jgi:hypothetical protein